MKKNKAWAMLNDILEAAARQVASWPAWMQRPEHRQRPPAGNSPSKKNSDE